MHYEPLQRLTFKHSGTPYLYIVPYPTDRYPLVPHTITDDILVEISAPPERTSVVL